METLRALCCLSGMVLLQSAIAADNYPNRPIRFLVPGATGSSQDLLSRIVANKLSQQLNQQVVVDVRAGASGVIGIELGKAAAPDGYTIIAATSTLFAGLPALKTKLSYDPDRDFAPLTRIATVANVMTVNAGLGVESVADLVKLAKAKPGQLNYGSAGNGSPAHLAGAMFDVLADVKTSHVPYKGAAQALTDVIGGQLQYLITSPLVAMPHAKGGRIKVLATTGAKRDPLIPDLPTVADTVPGYQITQWWGVAVPAKTPPAIVAKLHAEIIKALQAPEVRDLVAKQGATVQPESPAEFAAFMLAERVRISNLGKQANIRLDD
ncbi:MAG: tripartite tricarboxylate transporter substrate binding protein [Proteobacteria bacterium]|nr:tripartite tricarboxylate transporter substrate binding protein [Pseudomonadota bacterium]